MGPNAPSQVKRQRRVAAAGKTAATDCCSLWSRRNATVFCREALRSSICSLSSAFPCANEEKKRNATPSTGRKAGAAAGQQIRQQAGVEVCQQPDDWRQEVAR